MSKIGAFRRFVTSFDVFGEPVSLNYNGGTTFKTLIGAMFTIMIKCFILIFAMQ